jgi:hypothetical protein
MSRSIVLAYWEIRRILRVKIAVLALLLVPIVFVLGNVLLADGKTTFLKTSFPGIAIICVWIFLYVRAWFDRASGFALGVNSTPAAGGIIFASRILTGIGIILVQMIIFLIAIRFIH